MLFPQCKRLGTRPTAIPKRPRAEDDSESEAEDDEDEVASEASDDSEDLMNEVDELDADEDDEESEGKLKGGKPLKTLYELNDTLYAEAEVDEDGNVGLWLGVSFSCGYAALLSTTNIPPL